jgi:uncharacterized membrane protein YphA (DoxX/SURF4 family)
MERVDGMKDLFPKTKAAWLGLLATIAVSLLFLIAGWSKVIDPEAFARSIQGYQLLPDSVIPWMSWVLPWLEVWCALALWLSKPFRKAAWIWVLLMLVVFTVAKASAVLRGLDISCGCTGSDTPLTWKSVWENLGWIVVTLVGAFSATKSTQN